MIGVVKIKMGTFTGDIYKLGVYIAWIVIAYQHRNCIFFRFRDLY